MDGLIRTDPLNDLFGRIMKNDLYCHQFYRFSLCLRPVDLRASGSDLSHIADWLDSELNGGHFPDKDFQLSSTYQQWEEPEDRLVMVWLNNSTRVNAAEISPLSKAGIIEDGPDDPGYFFLHFIRAPEAVSPLNVYLNSLRLVIEYLFEILGATHIFVRQAPFDAILLEGRFGFTHYRELGNGYAVYFLNRNMYQR